MDHREELLTVFHVDQRDLDANRAGSLGELQKQALIRSGTRSLMGSFLIAAVLGGILYLVARKPLAPVQWILAAVLIIAALATGIYEFRRTRAAAADGRVERLTGTVQAQSRGKGGWYLLVAGRSFRLPVHFWNLRSDVPYRVYVSPQANRIVAMEPDGSN